MKTKKTMDVVLIVIAVFLTIFTGVMVWCFLQMGNCPDSLIVAVFGACLGEFGFMAWIKNTKEIHGGFDNDGDEVTDYD